MTIKTWCFFAVLALASACDTGGSSAPEPVENPPATAPAGTGAGTSVSQGCSAGELFPVGLCTLSNCSDGILPEGGLGGLDGLFGGDGGLSLDDFNLNDFTDLLGGLAGGGDGGLGGLGGLLGDIDQEAVAACVLTNCSAEVSQLSPGCTACLAQSGADGLFSCVNSGAE